MIQTSLGLPETYPDNAGPAPTSTSEVEIHEPTGQRSPFPADTVASPALLAAAARGIVRDRLAVLGYLSSSGRDTGAFTLAEQAAIANFVARWNEGHPRALLPTGSFNPANALDPVVVALRNPGAPQAASESWLRRYWWLPVVSDDVTARLLAGEMPAEIAAALGLDLGETYEDDHPVVVLPGWAAADESGERIHYPDAAEGSEAAQEYADGGQWDSEAETWWCHVRTWRVGLCLGEGGEIVEHRLDSGCHSIEIEPEEPDCAVGEDHDWQSPIEVVGGCRESPGVRGHSGGVVIHEVCAHCGVHRLTDTWATDRQDGTQGHESVRYEPLDAASREWVASMAEAEEEDEAAAAEEVRR